jgi:hypothetical protein
MFFLKRYQSTHELINLFFLQKTLTKYIYKKNYIKKNDLISSVQGQANYSNFGTTNEDV